MDTATGVVSIRPSATTWDHVIVEDAPEEEAVISKKARLPRPPNAFILYRQHHHPIVKEAHPDLHNNQICKSPSFPTDSCVNISPSDYSWKAVEERG